MHKWCSDMLGRVCNRDFYSFSIGNESSARNREGAGKGRDFHAGGVRERGGNPSPIPPNPIFFLFILMIEWKTQPKYQNNSQLLCD